MSLLNGIITKFYMKKTQNYLKMREYVQKFQTAILCNMQKIRVKLATQVRCTNNLFVEFF
jgi:hypothetical protein